MTEDSILARPNGNKKEEAVNRDIQRSSSYSKTLHAHRRIVGQPTAAATEAGTRKKIGMHHPTLFEDVDD